jgi:hypothetical protein
MISSEYLVVNAEPLDSDTDFREFVKHYAWLLNETGRKNGFIEIDLFQEHCICEIKAS